MVILGILMLVVVPNVVGLTKSAAASKLKDAGFNYNFVYQASNSVQKDKVISQSIKEGQEITSFCDYLCQNI